MTAGYPGELEEHWQAGEERLWIRPIRPDDAAGLEALFRRLSPGEIRFRFFAAIRELTAEQLTRFTRLDYAREMALIALREGPQEIVAVARLMRGEAHERAEFAIVVQHELQGCGLAVHLMRGLLAWARRQGVREVFGSILADNTPMLELARFLGFRLAHRSGEPGVMDARLELAPAGPA